MSRSIEDVACTLCGCVCDDLKVRVVGNRIVAAEGACFLAEPWFLNQGASDSPPALIDGKPAELEAAIQRAAMILGESRAPLIYGLSRSSTPGQRAAVCLADRLGATIDTTASTCHAPSIMALQSVGESTSTLGEVKNRADLVIYWGSNPLESHPRHMQLFVDSAGMFVPDGRRNRHLIVVDVKRTETAKLADTFIKIKPGGDFELIWALRLLCQGGLDANFLNQKTPLDLPKEIAGVPIEQIQSMAQRMMECDYGGVFFGLGLASQNVAHASVEALLRLVTDLNAHTRFVVRRMRVPGDVAGADSVLCWQTGFPFSVNLSRGYPRFNPGEYTAATLLERKEVDATVMVGSEGVEKFSDQARQYLTHTQNIVLDSPSVTCPIPAAVQFCTAIYGIHRSGTAYRMDEVPIPLRPLLESSLPSDDEILTGIYNALR